MPTTECPSNTTGDRLTHALGRAASGSCGRSTAGPGALPPRPGSASPRNAGRSARAQFAGSTTRSRSHTARVLAVHPPEHLPLLRVRQCPPSPGRAFRNCTSRLPLPRPRAFNRTLYAHARCIPNDAEIAASDSPSAIRSSAMKRIPSSISRVNVRPSIFISPWTTVDAICPPIYWLNCVN